jgi:hypothetical protein
MKYIFKLLGLLILSANTVTGQNGVLNFDGINDYVDLGSTVATGTRTIEMWFKPGNTINSNLSVHKGLIARENAIGTNVNEFNLSFIPSGISSNLAGTLRFTIHNSFNTPMPIYSNSNIWNSSQWYHVAAVIHPSQGMSLFIDGIRQISTHSNSQAISVSNSPTTIGSWGLAANRFFNGAIDDVRLSDSALYSSNFSPSCFNLRALFSTTGVWNFDNTSFSNIAIDSSNNQNNGIINGAIKSVEDICKVTTIANCLELDGVNDHIDLGSTIASGARTIEMWFSPNLLIDNTLSNFATLIARETFAVGQADEFIISFEPSFTVNSGALKFLIFSPNGTRYAVYSNSNQWNANQWYHAAAVIHPLQGLLLFIDGIKQNSTTPYIFPPNPKNDPTLVGTQGNLSGRYFNGKIDDLRLSNSALYSVNFTPPCQDIQATSNTMAVFNFNDSSNVTIAVDSSGNNNNGIIYGANGVIDTICPPVTTSINVIRKSDTKVLVFPNPMVNEVHFKFSKDETAEIEIILFSIDGKLITKTSGNSSITINTELLPSGMYFYKVIEDGKAIAANKLIKK